MPCGPLFELPGRPHVLWQLQSYAGPATEPEGVQQARNDVPFLFKAFETGQIGAMRERLRRNACTYPRATCPPHHMPH